jgi:hypothetical protein
MKTPLLSLSIREPSQPPVAAVNNPAGVGGLASECPEDKMLGETPGRVHDNPGRWRDIIQSRKAVLSREQLERKRVSPGLLRTQLWISSRRTLMCQWKLMPTRSGWR